MSTAKDEYPARNVIDFNLDMRKDWIRNNWRYTFAGQIAAAVYNAELQTTDDREEGTHLDTARYCVAAADALLEALEESK